MSKLLNILTLAAISLLLLTNSAHAALIPCATAENPQICSLCDILVLGNNLTNWFAGILLPLGILAFGISGVLYLIQKPDQAKSLMASAAKGIIISLSAFLIVNITLRALDVVQPTDWNTFTCTSKVADTTVPKPGYVATTGGDGGPKDTVGNPGDITGDSAVTPESVVCNEGRDTSTISKSFPLALTLSCTNTDKIISAIWHFPSDSNFASQTIDSRQNLRTNNTDTVTFTSASNPDNWNEVTVDVTEMNGTTKTYVYGLGGLVATGPGTYAEAPCPPIPSNAYEYVGSRENIIGSEFSPVGPLHGISIMFLRKPEIRWIKLPAGGDNPEGNIQPKRWQTEEEYEQYGTPHGTIWRMGSNWQGVMNISRCPGDVTSSNIVVQGPYVNMKWYSRAVGLPVNSIVGDMGGGQKYTVFGLPGLSVPESEGGQSWYINFRTDSCLFGEYPVDGIEGGEGTCRNAFHIF